MRLRRTSKLLVDVPAVASGDIAFNLLVFFVILAKGQDDSHLQWTPAKADNVQSAGYSKVSVVIDRDEKVYLNGQPISESQLTSAIEANLGKAQAGDRKVLLKAHKDCTAIRFEPVIEAISLAGGELVHVLDDKKKK